MASGPFSDDFLAAISSTCIGMVARSAARAATRVLDAHLGDLDLQATQLPILVMIRLYGDEGIAGLSHRLDLDASALTRNVQLLERKGYVLAQGGRGRGGKHLSLSQVGEILLEAAVGRWQAAQNALLEELGVGDADVLRRALTRLEAVADRVTHQIQFATP